jgi:hypothetical protein
MAARIRPASPAFDQEIADVIDRTTLFCCVQSPINVRAPMLTGLVASAPRADVQFVRGLRISEVADPSFRRSPEGVEPVHLWLPSAMLAVHDVRRIKRRGCHGDSLVARSPFATGCFGALVVMPRAH